MGRDSMARLSHRGFIGACLSIYHHSAFQIGPREVEECIIRKLVVK